MHCAECGRESLRIFGWNFQNGSVLRVYDSGDGVVIEIASAATLLATKNKGCDLRNVVGKDEWVDMMEAALASMAND